MKIYFMESIYLYTIIIFLCLAVRSVSSKTIPGRWVTVTWKKGSLNFEVEKKLIPIRKTIYKIVSKYTEEKPLEKKIEQIIEREIKN